MSDERITLRAAAAQFRVSVEMLRKAAQRQRLPAAQVGTVPHAVWLVYPSDVAAYVATHRPRAFADKIDYPPDDGHHGEPV